MGYIGLRVVAVDAEMALTWAWVDQRVDVEGDWLAGTRTHHDDVYGHGGRIFGGRVGG